MFTWPSSCSIDGAAACRRGRHRDLPGASHRGKGNRARSDLAHRTEEVPSPGAVPWTVGVFGTPFTLLCGAVTHAARPPPAPAPDPTPAAAAAEIFRVPNKKSINFLSDCKPSSCSIDRAAARRQGRPRDLPGASHRGKGNRARSTLANRTEEAPHRRVRCCSCSHLLSFPSDCNCSNGLRIFFLCDAVLPRCDGQESTELFSLCPGGMRQASPDVCAVDEQPLRRCCATINNSSR